MTLSRISSILGIAVLVAMLLAILAIAVSEVHSFDVFWQLQAGKYMWQTKAFIRTDTFTLVHDVPRYEHTWLHSLLLYGFYCLKGYPGISIFKGVVVTLAVVVLCLAARVRQSSFCAIALVLPAFLLTSGGWLERPQIWTFLLCAVFIWRLEAFRTRPSWGLLWLLPVALFWANVHAGSVLMVAVTGAYLVGETAEGLLLRRWAKGITLKLSVLLVGIVLAALINPYPEKWLNILYRAHEQGATSVDKATGKTTGPVTAIFNMDWTPTTFAQEPLFFYAMGITALIMLLGFRRLKLTDVCLLVGFSLMGLKLVRHIPFFYLGVVAILPAYLDAIGGYVRDRASVTLGAVAKIVVLLVAIAGFSYIYGPLYTVYGGFKTGLREWHYPIAATEFVETHKLPKNLYNTYDWGGYMAFKLYPDYLMFWDGRQNDADMFSLGWQVMAGHGGWEKILDRFDVKTIVSRASTIDTGQKYPLLDRLKASSEWSLVFSTESSLVFVRNDSVPQDWLKRYAKPKERIDDTVLSEAHLMVKYNANRYMAWWEMAQIYAKRKQYSHALFAVRQHLARSRQQNPAAVRLQQQLTMLTKNR